MLFLLFLWAISGLLYPGVFRYTWETDHLTKFVGSDLIYGFVEFNLGFYPLLQLHEDRAIRLTLVYGYTHNAHIPVLLLMWDYFLKTCVAILM